MAFSAMQDFFGFAGDSAVCVRSNPNKSIEYSEAADQCGNICARDVYGSACAPACDYKLKAAIAAADWPSLGTVIASSTAVGQPVMISSLQISTGAGQEATVTISGVGVEAGATTGKTFKLSGNGGIGELACTRCAQILAGAFTLSGDGCHLASCSLSATCSAEPTKVGGVAIASDCWDGVVEVSAQIIAAGAAAPVVTAATGWDLVSALSPQDADTERTTYDIVLRKTLTVTPRPTNNP